MIAAIVITLLIVLIFWVYWIDRNYERGVVYLKLNDLNNAEYYFKKASKLGSVRAKMSLAELYATGNKLDFSFDKNRILAVKYLEMLPEKKLEIAVKSIIYSIYRWGGDESFIANDEVQFWLKWYFDKTGKSLTIPAFRSVSGSDVIQDQSKN